MFTRGDVESVKIMMGVFKDFFEVTGLVANIAKSKVDFGGVNIDVQQKILDFTGFAKGGLPFRQLGIPLDSRKLTVAN